MRVTFAIVVFSSACSLPVDSADQTVVDPAPTFSIVTGDFHAAVGGTNITFCDPGGTPCATPTPIQVRWGVPADVTGQSGLGFDPTAPVVVTYGASFAIGALSHFNFPT